MDQTERILCYEPITGRFYNVADIDKITQSIIEISEKLIKETERVNIEDFLKYILEPDIKEHLKEPFLNRLYKMKGSLIF